MDFKKKYLKYKSKYLELKKQIGGDDDIYIKLWNIKDRKEFDDNKDGKVSKDEYQKNIDKYFNYKAINFTNLDEQTYEDKTNSIFQFSDENNDNILSDNEVISLSKRIRAKERLRIGSKDELNSQEYTSLKKIMGMEHICPKGQTDRKFRGDPSLETEKILKMFLRMRYLVEVKGKSEYITLDNRTKYEEEIFNLVCNNKDKCKFHNLQISDFESSTIDEYVKILKIIKKYEDPNIDGSLVVHCGAGSGRTGTIFMIYIWFTDYINNTNNCVDETNKILDILNKLNLVLNKSMPILKIKISELKDDDYIKRRKQKYYDMIQDLNKINSENLEVLLKRRKFNLHEFEDSLFQNLEDLYKNEYLLDLKSKVMQNYTKAAANELFNKDDYGLFYIRLYRMIMAIKQIEN